MPMFEGTVNYSVIEEKSIALDAYDMEEFEQNVIESVEDEYPDAYNIVVGNIREVK